MATKKVAKKAATKKQPKPAAELVGGRFRQGSELAKMYELLLDGKARTVAEINKVTKSEKPANIAFGKFQALKEFGQESKTFDLVKEDGKIQMTNIRMKKAA